MVTGTHPADLPQKDGRIQFEQQANISPEFSSWLKWLTEPSLDRRLSSAKEALQALEYPSLNGNPSLKLNRGDWYWNGNNWIRKKQQDKIAPLLIRKPSGSKILLTKDENYLEILMPRKGVGTEVVSLTLFAIAWNSFLVMWTDVAVFSVPFGVNIFFALFSLPFWGAGINLVWQILYTLFGRVRLCINQQQIWQSYEIFGFKSKRLLLRPDISKLELEYLGDRSRIIIWIGTHKYELGGYGHITYLELEWLAHELSDWLQLPIQVNQRLKQGIKNN